MAENKIDITSTVIEKGIDLVKDFLEKLIGSTLEETGLLISDNIKLIRFKNQIKILNKAKKIVDDNDIHIKQISLKALVPLLEYSSLESEETLQDKWTNLLVNFIDSNEKYESTVFPFILNQLSSSEIIQLEKINQLPFIALKDITITNAGLANLVRLGVIELKHTSGNFIYRQGEIPPIKYVITGLGKEFINCCSPKC